MPGRLKSQGANWPDVIMLCWGWPLSLDPWPSHTRLSDCPLAEQASPTLVFPPSLYARRRTGLSITATPTCHAT